MLLLAAVTGHEGVCVAEDGPLVEDQHEGVCSVAGAVGVGLVDQHGVDQHSVVGEGRCSSPLSPDAKKFVSPKMD